MDFEYNNCHKELPGAMILIDSDKYRLSAPRRNSPNQRFIMCNNCGTIMIGTFEKGNLIDLKNADCRGTNRGDLARECAVLLGLIPIPECHCDCECCSEPVETEELWEYKPETQSEIQPEKKQNRIRNFIRKVLA